MVMSRFSSLSHSCHGCQSLMRLGAVSRFRFLSHSCRGCHGLMRLDAVKNIFTFFRSFLPEITRRDSSQNSCRFSFSFFPVEERELTGEASSTEESERIGIFPDAASSSGLHRLAMLATAFLASEKIPMILSDNDRRGLTLQEKEDAARLKFSCVPGCSDAQPCQCLRR